MRRPTTLIGELIGELVEVISAALPSAVHVAGVARKDISPPFSQLIVELEPSSKATAITRWVRLQLTGVVVREDMTSNYQEATFLVERAYSALAALPGRIVSCEIDAGPMRIINDNNLPTAYAVLLLTVC